MPRPCGVEAGLQQGVSSLCLVERAPADELAQDEGAAVERAIPAALGGAGQCVETSP
jgi:hypothetical protein